MKYIISSDFYNAIKVFRKYSQLIKFYNHSPLAFRFIPFKKDKNNNLYVGQIRNTKTGIKIKFK